MKRSAGVVVYKKENNIIKVLLCHFGGPYFEGMDDGAWSFSKGEIENHEDILDTVKREFKEETNLEIDGKLEYLGSKKISRKKLCIMFYVEKDYLLDNCFSNTFKKEYPSGSGIIREFPEMDKYSWFSLEEAKLKIHKSQLFFIKKLEEKL